MVATTEPKLVEITEASCRLFTGSPSLCSARAGQAPAGLRAISI
jgi:hypothetical protein